LFLDKVIEPVSGLHGEPAGAIAGAARDGRQESRKFFLIEDIGHGFSFSSLINPFNLRGEL
jgi:hypothetical protein